MDLFKKKLSVYLMWETSDLWYLVLKKKCLMSKISLLSLYCFWSLSVIFSILHHSPRSKSVLYLLSRGFDIVMSSSWWQPQININHIMMSKLMWCECKLNDCKTILGQSSRDTLTLSREWQEGISGRSAAFRSGSPVRTKTSLPT